jgi:FKBP-type peptidyl-prolyl cis-trans isomerase
MMNNWKDLLVISTLWSGLSLYALQDPGVTPVSTKKGTLPDSRVPAVPPTKDSTVSVVEQITKEKFYLTIYGHIVAKNTGILELGLTSSQLGYILDGIKGAFNGEKLPEVKPDEMEGLQQFFERKRDAYLAEVKKRGEEFLALKAKEPGIQKTASGVLCKITNSGNGDRPNGDCIVEIDYEVKSIDGEILEHGERESIFGGMFPPGFFEAIQLVGQGGEGQAWMPSDLAYEDGSVLGFSFKIYKITRPTWGNEEPNGQTAPKKEEPKTEPKASSK